MAATRFKRLDVLELFVEGIEPYPEIRRWVDALAAGEGLAVIAPFLPSPLIEKLCSEGFTSRVETAGDGSFVAYFSR